MMQDTEFEYSAAAGVIDTSGMFSFKKIGQQIAWCELVFESDTWEYNPHFHAICFKNKSQLNWFKLYWE